MLDPGPMKRDAPAPDQLLTLDEEEATDLKLIEELFYRIEQSQAISLHAPLPKKSSNLKTLAQLQRIERAIIEKARRRPNSSF